MAKYSGKIGFAEESQETSPGVWEEVIVERRYKFDVTRDQRRLTATDTINEDLAVTNYVSVVMDSFLPHHFHSIRYVEWHGSKWKVTTVEVQAPRLVMTIGALYNA